MKTLLKILKAILSRVFIFYLIIFGLSLQLVNYKDIKNRVKIRNLNDRMPLSFDHLIQIGGGAKEVNIDEDQIRDYVRYFQTVAKYLPKYSEGHSLLGFSYYQSGKVNEALSSFEKASVINPHFFLNYYNLAVIYYEKGDYEKAIKLFSIAAGKDPKLGLTVLLRSLEYQRIFRNVKNLSELLASGLKSAYTDNFKMLILSNYKLKNYTDMIILAQKAIALDLNDKEQFMYLAGLAAFHLKEYKKSIYFLKESLDIFPNSSEAYYYMALNLKMLGLEAQANKTLYLAAQLRKVDAHSYETPPNLRIY